MKMTKLHSFLQIKKQAKRLFKRSLQVLTDNIFVFFCFFCFFFVIQRLTHVSFLKITNEIKSVGFYAAKFPFLLIHYFETCRLRVFVEVFKFSVLNSLF